MRSNTGVQCLVAFLVVGSFGCTRTEQRSPAAASAPPPAAPSPSKSLPPSIPLEPASPPPCSKDGWCAERLPVPVGTKLTAIDTGPTGKVWIGGSGGSLFHLGAGPEWAPNAEDTWWHLEAGVTGDVTSIYVGKDAVWIAANELWMSEDDGTFKPVKLPPGSKDEDAGSIVVTQLWGDGGAPFIVGGVGPQQYLWVPAARGWRAVPIQRSARVNAIHGGSTKDVWIGGEEQLLLHWNGKSLEPAVLARAEGDDSERDPSVLDDADALDGVRALWRGGVLGIAAMDRGPRKLVKPREWRHWAVPAGCRGDRIAGTSANDVWLANGQVICRYDGASFHSEELPPGTHVDAIAAAKEAVWVIDSRQPFVFARRTRARAP